MEEASSSPSVPVIRRPWFRVLVLAAAIEAGSYLAYFWPFLKPLALAAFLVVAVYLAVRDLRALFYLAVIEAVIGGHGHLFDHSVAGSSLSIRMVLFGVLVLGWLIHVRRDPSHLRHLKETGLAAPLIAVAAVVAWGAVRALMLGRGAAAVFDDANGYAFILLVPIALDLLADRRALSTASQVFTGALAWLAVKSLALMYFFTHGFAFLLPDLYAWQRKFFLAEITAQGGGWYRVFSGSDVFLMIGASVAVFLLAKKVSRGLVIWTAFIFAAFILSMSRSFWLGSLAGLVAVLPAVFRSGWAGRREMLRLPMAVLSAIVLGIAALVLVAAAPPVRSGGSGWISAFGERFTGGDAAVSSRWRMLPPLEAAIGRSPMLGSGFGATVTYQSDDKRMHALFPGGLVTTPAVEWQYLEIWLKTGFGGLVAVAWLLWKILVYVLSSIKKSAGSDRTFSAGLAAALVAFIVANIFTPYLNHPLGWMFLALIAAGAHAAQARDASVISG